MSVWCGIRFGGIRTFFFGNKSGNAVTINGKRYRNTLQKFFWHQLKDVKLDVMKYVCVPTWRFHISHTQKNDDFPCREVSETVFLKRSLIDRPDLAIQFHSLCLLVIGISNLNTYANKRNSITVLKNEIRRVLGQIDSTICKNVIENFVKKNCCVSIGGDILFHD